MAHSAGRRHGAVKRSYDCWSSAAPLRRYDRPNVSPLIAAEELLEIILRRYERASTLVTSNRPVGDWGQLLGDAAAVSAMLDRLLHHGRLLEYGARSWCSKMNLPAKAQAG